MINKRTVIGAIVATAIMLSMLSANALWATHNGTPEVRSYPVSGSPEHPADSVWNNISGTVVPLDVTPEGGNGHDRSEETPDMLVKAAYNQEYLYMFYEWQDPDVSNIFSYWEFNGASWELIDLEQDRLYVEWPINDVAGEAGDRNELMYSQIGCAKTCHRFAAATTTGYAKDTIFPTPGPINNCGACHQNADTASYDFNHEYIDHETENPDIVCLRCHSGGVDRGVIANENGVTIATDHAAPAGGLYDVWHWKAMGGTAGRFADDQYLPSGKKRTNDGTPSLEVDNWNSSTAPTRPLKMWHPSSGIGLDRILTKRMFLNQLVTVSASNPTKLEDGTTIPTGSVVRRKYVNNMDGHYDNLNIGAQSRWIKGTWQLVLKRKLNSGDSRDYSFLNSDDTLNEGPHYFGLAVTNNNELIHPGSNVNKLIFEPDATAPTTKLEMPRYSSNTSSGLPFKVSWSANDGVPGIGISNISLDWRPKGGSWSEWINTWKNGSSTFGANSISPLTPVEGGKYEIRMTATDAAGNSASAESFTFIPENQTAFGFSSGWTNVNNSNLFRGNAKRTVGKAQATLNYSGKKELALIATRQPGGGKIEIWLGNTRIKTVDLNATSTQYRRAVWSKLFNTATSGKLIIKALGTGKVDLDAVVRQ